MIRKETIYIRPFLDNKDDEYGNPFNKYGEAIEMNESLNSVSGSYDAIVYGDRAKQMVQTFVDYDEYIGKLKEGDLAYLYGASVQNEKYIGGNANYEIDSVLPQNKKIKVTFKKRV